MSLSDSSKLTLLTIHRETLDTHPSLSNLFLIAAASLDEAQGMISRRPSSTNSLPKTSIERQILHLLQNEPDGLTSDEIIDRLNEHRRNEVSKKTFHVLLSKLRETLLREKPELEIRRNPDRTYTLVPREEQAEENLHHSTVRSMRETLQKFFEGRQNQPNFDLCELSLGDAPRHEWPIISIPRRRLPPAKPWLIVKLDREFTELVEAHFSDRRIIAGFVPQVEADRLSKAEPSLEIQKVGNPETLFVLRESN
jgi:predicted transcriptional regulator